MKQCYLGYEQWLIVSLSIENETATVEKVRKYQALENNCEESKTRNVISKQANVNTTNE